MAYTYSMEKVYRAYKTHADAEAADREFIRSLSMEDRWRMMCEIVAQNFDDPPQRLQRVHRVTKRREG